MIDPTIPLQSRPADLGIMTDAQKTLQQQQALQAQQQSQAQALENQQRALQAQQQSALNDAYRAAFSSSAPGTAAGGAIDPDKLTQALALSGHGSAIPSILDGFSKYQKELVDTKKTMADLRSKQIDFAGGVGATLKQANGDPRLFLTMGAWALDQQAVPPAVLQPMMAKVAQALQQDPSGQSARQIVQQIADQWIAQSPEQQKLASDRTTADARKTAAENTAAKDAPINLANWQKTKGLVFGNAKSQADWDAAIANAKASGADLSDVPVTFSPEAAQRLSQAALTEKEKADIKVGQQNANANTARAGVETQRNAREQAMFSMGVGAAAGENPAAKAMANYQLPPIAARSAATPAGQALMKQVLAINPEYDAKLFPQIAKTNQAYITGAQGQNAVALNTAIAHSALLADAVKTLGNGNFRLGNDVTNRLKAEFGGSAPTNFDQIKMALAGESAKVLKGVATNQEVDAAAANISRANSPTQLLDALKVNYQIYGGKLGALEYQYKQGTQGKGNLKILSPDSEAILRSNGIDPETMKPSSAAHGIPELGSTFNGGRVLKVTKIQ